MLPRAAGIVVMFGCVAAHLTWRRAVLLRLGTYGATRGRTLLRLSLCFRTVIHASGQFHVLSRTNGATRGRTLHRIRAATQFYVRPRIGPSLSRSSPYCRALSHVAAQCYVLPRTHGAKRRTTLRVFAYVAAQCSGLL